jgi:hypothetical protein
MNLPWYLKGSKLITISPIWTIRRQVVSTRLDSIYLTSGKPIDEEERLRALMAYIADLVADTGELDLTVGRVPSKEQETQKPATASEGDMVDVTMRTGDNGSESELQPLTEE